MYDHNEDLFPYLNTSLPIDKKVKLADQAGSTAATVLIDTKHKKLVTANLGDSEIILTDLNKVLYKSKQHNYKNKTEKARVIKVGGHFDKDKYVEYEH